MTQVFIDRRDHARVLETFVEAVPSGARALWLHGEAGIGKTTLLDHGIGRAEALGFRVLVARAARAEAPLAFASLGDLVAPVLDESLSSIPPVQRRALETALLLREPEGQPPDTRVLGLALLSVLGQLAGGAPVLVALDDAQWIDSSSLEVLSFTLRRLGDEPVGLLASIREPVSERSVALGTHPARRPSRRRASLAPRHEPPALGAVRPAPVAAEPGEGPPDIGREPVPRPRAGPFGGGGDPHTRRRTADAPAAGQ